jgi:hypothetical protein
MYLIIMQHTTCSMHPTPSTTRILTSATLHSDKVAGLTIALSSSLHCNPAALLQSRTAHSLSQSSPHRRHSCPANTLDCPPACRTFTTSAKSSRPEVGNGKSQELAYLRRDTLQLHARNENAMAGELPRQNLQTYVSRTLAASLSCGARTCL